MFGVKKGFDIVIGNPPYGAEVEEKHLLKILSRIKDTKNKNTAALFIDISKNLLINKTGTVSLIVPKSLLYSEKWYSQVLALADHTISIMDVEKAFENVLLEQVVFIFNWKSSSSHYKAQKFQNGIVSPAINLNINIISRFQAWVCDVSLDEMELGLKVSKIGTYMKNISTTTRGFPIQKELRSRGELPVIGGKNISRYGIKGEKGFINKKDIDPSNKKLSYLLQPKIVSQNIVAHIQNPFPHIMIATFPDEEGRLLSVDTVNNTVLNSSTYTPTFISAVLNSKLINWYVYKFIYCSAIRTMHFDETYVGKIPIPVIGIDETNEIEMLFREMMSLKGENPEIDLSVQEEKINHLIYDIYSLFDQEIAIVEGNLGDSDEIIPSPGETTYKFIGDLTETIEAIDIPRQSDYEIYKCGLCGKLIIGHDRESHSKEYHHGQAEWDKLKK